MIRVQHHRASPMATKRASWTMALPEKSNITFQYIARPPHLQGKGEELALGAFLVQFTMALSYALMYGGLPIITDQRLHSQFLHFFVVILAVKNVPLLAALKNRALLVLYLLARGLVDFCFLVQQVFENLAHFKSYSVSVFDEIHCLHLRQRVRYHVRNLVDLVPTDSHSTALYLRVSSLFTLRNIS